MPTLSWLIAITLHGHYNHFCCSKVISTTPYNNHCFIECCYVFINFWTNQCLSLVRIMYGRTCLYETQPQPPLTLLSVWICDGIFVRKSSHITVFLQHAQNKAIIKHNIRLIRPVITRRKFSPLGHNFYFFNCVPCDFSVVLCSDYTGRQYPFLCDAF